MGFLAESKRFELSNGFRPLHDFQSCSLDQLGQLSTARLFILYTARKKKSRHFSVLICENFIRQAQKRAPPHVRLFRRRRRTVVSRSLSILKGRRAGQKDCSNQSPRKQDFRFFRRPKAHAPAHFSRGRASKSKKALSSDSARQLTLNVAAYFSADFREQGVVKSVIRHGVC